MYTSFAIVALTSSLVASSPREDLTWQKDYMQARTVGQAEKKPLAVFVGTGANGYERVCADGKLSAEVQKSLADNYICLYADVSTPAGQKLAADLSISRGMGLILSSRSGDVQAFSHDGDLSAADLTRWVSYAADPNLMVRTTMSNSRVSMYPPNTNGYVVNGSGYMMNGSYQYAPGNVIYGGGCPGGNCGGGGGILFRR